MFLFTLITLLSINLVIKANEIKSDTANDQDFEALGLHYGKYLKEVVEALDKDQKFTETIKNMDANDIKSGKVAEQLKHVHEDVRKKLNDLKYLEIKRLRDLATRKNEMETLGETYHGSDKRKWRTVHKGMKMPDHLGSDAAHFDMDDLHKLMVAATNDLEKLDKERREDFKTYEMEKEWQFEERLKMMNETEKQEAIKLRKNLKEKHNQHDKVHEPGSKSQFEDVWEKKDNLPRSEFDPKTFFALHDTNSDNYWDPDEVKKLLDTEIKKLYDPNNPEDDPNEMDEEFERMREHVYKEIDTDRDGLISQKEFLDYSKKPEFKTDHGWNDLSKEDAFSQKDYEDYKMNREKMLKSSHGYYDPYHYQNQPQNLHLPEYGWGMPHGANPAQYYGYHVDPNHPQAQQILAQQNLAYQQNLALQHQAYQQPGVVPQHPQAAAGYHPQQPNQAYYQPPNQQQQQQAAVPQIQQQQPSAGQINYQQQQAAPVAQAGQQQQQNYQQPPPVQQQPNQQQQQQQPNQYYQAQPAQNNQQQFQQQKPPVIQQQQPQAGYQQPQQVPSQAPAVNFQQPPVQQQTQQQSNQNYQQVK